MARRSPDETLEPRSFDRRSNHFDPSDDEEGEDAR
jgi:hypothetical protein